MEKKGSSRSAGNRGGKSRNQVSSKAKGPGGLPSKTGNPSGGGRTNVSSRKKGK